MTQDVNWQEKYQQMQALNSHIEQIGEHVQRLAANRSEIENSKEALQGLKSTQKAEVFAPIANGIFIKTQLTENQKLLVNVGADVVVEKDVDEVVSLLGKQQEEITKNIIQGEAMLEEFHGQMMSMYKEVENKE